MKKMSKGEKNEYKISKNKIKVTKNILIFLDQTLSILFIKDLFSIF